MNNTRASTLVSLIVLAVGCDGGGEPAGGPGAPVTPVLVTPTVVAETRPRPRDLDFNPRRSGELWVVNAGDHSVTIVHGATGPTPTKVENRRDRGYSHFMPSPSSIAFGADPTNDAAPNAALASGTFATCPEDRNPTLDRMNRTVFSDFMGPVLWSSDLDVFATRPGTLGSHLDMLHQSPLCMGIAWEGKANIYWTYNGLSRSVARYDFALDHGVGNDDHSDGYVWRFLNGQLGYVAGVPSHIFYDTGEAVLYVADTGNSRILRLDPQGSQQMGPLVPAMDERAGFEMTGEQLREVVTKSSGHLQQPSGLEIFQDHLYVSDTATSVISKLRRDGTLVAQVKTELPAGSLSGMSFGPDGRLYFVDMVGNKVLRLEAPF